MKSPLRLVISFLSFLPGLLLTEAMAQAPVKEWDLRYGGSGGDDLGALQQTTDDGYILGGSSQSSISGDKSQNSQGFYDYWILKTDADGVKLWDATFGGSANDNLVSLQQTSDGGYILGGYSSSGMSGDKTQDSQGGADYWIVKTDGAGTKLWDVRFGGSADDILRSVIQTSDGGYLLMGFSGSGISGDKTQASQGNDDFWIVKTDADGVKQWDYRYGGSENDRGISAKQTQDGGYILAGFSDSGISGDKTQSSQGYGDYWIVKIDGNGAMQWDARFGGNQYDYLYDVLQADDGGYILGGYSQSGANGDKSQPSQGSEDLWIVKTDNLGVKQWDYRYGGLNNDYFVSDQKTSDGGYLFGGYTDSDTGGDKTQDHWGVLYSYDYWVIKTDGDGIKEWDLDFGGTDWDQIVGAQQTADDGFILGGYSNSPVSGDKTQPSQGFDDYWLVKLICDGAQTYYADLDQDGFGDINNSSLSCVVPKGYVTDSTDCNDLNAEVYPGAPEIPGNGIDDDCDGLVDELSTGIASTEAISTLSVFPNPASDHFNIELSLPTHVNGDARLEVTNRIGQVIYKGTVPVMEGKLSEEISAGTISNGIYHVGIKINDRYISGTLLIQK